MLSLLDRNRIPDTTKFVLFLFFKYGKSEDILGNDFLVYYVFARKAMRSVYLYTRARVLVLQCLCDAKRADSRKFVHFLRGAFKPKG